MSAMTYDDRQKSAVKLAVHYADALIEIAAAWEESWVQGGLPWCSHCDANMDDPCGCHRLCPGLLARRALGVA